MHLCTAVSSSSGKSGQQKGNRTKAARKDEKATEKAEVEKRERAEVAYTEWKRAKVCSSLGVAVEQLTMSVFPFTTSHVERCSASLRLTHRTVGCLTAPHCASLCLTAPHCASLCLTAPHSLRGLSRLGIGGRGRRGRTQCAR